MNIVIDKDILSLDIAPNEPCDCFIHKAIANLTPENTEVFVQVDFIEIDEKKYICDPRLRQWQLDTIDIYYDHRDKYLTKPSPDEYEPIEFNLDDETETANTINI